MDQHSLPFDDISGNGPPAEQPCNIIVHKMQENRDPEIVCFHISKRKKYAQCNTGNKLRGNALKPCLRRIVK
mgnify:FL=1